MSSRIQGGAGEEGYSLTRALAPSLTRVIFPSPRRLFIYVLFAALFILAAREISDPDFWWHLRTGQYIVETKSVPHSDVFSFTSAGKEWVAHEWLSEVLIYMLFRTGGFTLLIVTFAALIAGALAFAYLRCEARPFVAGFVVLFGALASAPTWGVRPQMLSFLLTSVFLFLLDRYREKGDARLIVPLVPLMILWVNLHSGFALGLLLIAVYLAVLLFEGFASPVTLSGRAAIRKLFIVFLLALVSVMLNPNGARMYSYPFETLTSPAMQKYIQEWFSPDFHLVEFQPFGLLLIALIGLSLWSRSRISATSILLVLIFGYASLRSARNIPIFVLVAVPVLTRQVAGIFRERGWLKDVASVVSAPRLSGLLNGVLVLLVLGIIGLRVDAVADNQSRVEQDNFPAGAVKFIQSERPARNLFNSYSWGGYLIWRLYPEYRVYIDGRADVYGDAFIEDFLRIYRAEPGWSDRLAERNVRLVLVEPDSPLALAIATNSDWSRVYADTSSALFERK